jgi:hypothetical protein
VSGIPVKLSASTLAGLFLVAISTRVSAAPAVNSPGMPEKEAEGPPSVSEESDASDPDKPRPVKPPREPRSRGSEVSLQVGIGLLANGRYAYVTRVSQPGAYDLQYNGNQRAPGLGIFAGGAFTLPGRFRRITLGGTISAGGPDSKDRPVIPSGASPPFSMQNLNSDIQARYSRRLGWGVALAPFIEHDVGFFHERRVRAGYQFWSQAGSHTGSFPPNNGAPVANYDVRLSLRSHLVRVSVNEYVAFQEERDPSRRPRRRSGIIEQWGFVVGTHQTVMIFAAIGPFWQVAH